jgi:hypothetical protein
MVADPFAGFAESAPPCKRRFGFLARKEANSKVDISPGVAASVSASSFDKLRMKWCVLEDATKISSSY